MVESALVQARIDPAVKERASEVLQDMGLSISDAVRILLTRTAKEGALPFELTSNSAAYDAWFRAKVKAALDEPSPAVSEREVEAHFAKRRRTVAKA